MIVMFVFVDYEAPLHIFHPTDWVSAKKSPLKKVDGSANFEIKSDGVILVFSQVFDIFHLYISGIAFMNLSGIYQIGIV